jgi:uncharacterized membrane protein
MKLAALSIGSVALGGALVSAFALHGPSKISLSDSSGHSGQMQRESNSPHATRWMFSTLDNQNDATFNQLLGINNRGKIAGYFGSGAKGHANKGYLLVMSRRGSHYQNENVPRALQTQVTGLNDTGVTVGFWSRQNTASQANDNFGFYARGGRFHTVNFPSRSKAKPPVNQLLGVNDSNVAVGFYTDAKGNNHGYIYSITHRMFRTIKITGATSVTATAINNDGDIAGFFTNSAGMTKSFVRHWFGMRTTLAFPGATSTQAFGVNDAREVVGTYMKGTGDNAKTFGFTWTRAAGFKTVNDPQGKGTTTINGVNDAGDLVGFYTDAAGNTHGLLRAHRRQMAPPAPMPTMSATPTAMPTMTPTMSASPTMSAAPTMSPVPSKSAAPTMSPTMAPTMMPTTAPAPTSSASPPGGPW